MQGSRDDSALMVGIDSGANATNMKTVGGGRAPEEERGAQRGDERAVTVGESNACAKWDFKGQIGRRKHKKMKSQTKR
jgi:hypothetical protein